LFLYIFLFSFFLLVEYMLKEAGIPKHATQIKYAGTTFYNVNFVEDFLAGIK